MPAYRVGKEFLNEIEGTGGISPEYYNPNMGLEIEWADPIIEAATVAEVKQSLRINQDVDDEQIRRNLRTALTTIENYTNRTIIERQVTARWKRFPSVVHLPAPPQASITSVSTIDDDGTTTALTLNTDYYEYGSKEKWLEILEYNNQELSVVYQAGYGKSLDDLPTWARDAVIYQMGILFSNFDESVGTRVYDADSGLDQRAKVACSGNRYFGGS